MGLVGYNEDLCVLAGGRVAGEAAVGSYRDEMRKACSLRVRLSCLNACWSRYFYYLGSE